MSPRAKGLPSWAGRSAADAPPLPGQPALVLAGLAIGFLMLGAQLWLLTVALELLLSGHGETVWLCALTSGGIFAGGLFVRWVLGRRPRVHRLTTDEAGRVIRSEEPI